MLPLQADAYSFAVMMWELWAMKRVSVVAVQRCIC